MFCDCEYPASLPEKKSGSVEPAGPVSTEGKLKLTWP